MKKLHKVAYKPLKRNRYRLVIDGVLQPGKENIWTRSQILQQGLRWLEHGTTLRISRASSGQTAPKKQSPAHPSHYRAKQHRKQR